MHVKPVFVYKRLLFQIIDAEPEDSVMHYLVHYSGWNNRYDEWIRKDRIVGVVEETEVKKPVAKSNQNPSPARPPTTPGKAAKTQQVCGLTFSDILIHLNM